MWAHVSSEKLNIFLVYLRHGETQPTATKADNAFINIQHFAPFSPLAVQILLLLPLFLLFLCVHYLTSVPFSFFSVSCFAWFSPSFFYEFLFFLSSPVLLPDLYSTQCNQSTVNSSETGLQADSHAWRGFTLAQQCVRHRT